MVYIIEADTANELFIKIAKELLKVGTINTPRELKTLELQDVWLTLNNPSKSIVTLPERNLSQKYLDGEMEWYLSGSLDVKDIEKHSRFWSRLADTNGTVNSNYGYLTMKTKYAGKSQLEWVINTLKKDSNSRQAVMIYNQPHLHRYEGNKDYVCTLSQSFRKNLDGKLDSITYMRSNDLIYGLSYDLPWFTLIQKKVSNETGIPLGKYHHFDMSLHVYEKHFEMLKNIAAANNEKRN